MSEITHKEVEEYLLSMPGAKLDYPFGENTAVYKVFVPNNSSISHADGVQGDNEKRTEPYLNTVKGASELSTQQSAASTGRVPSSAGKQDSAMRGDWKMFALVTENKIPVQVSLKCDPLLAETLREKYDTVMPGYHLNKKHWNTILLTGQLPWEEVEGLITLSYNLVTKEANL
jgi:predicted DNA-binding protein (MmcQ/YjbR family)